MAIEKQLWIDKIMEGFIPDTSFLSRSVDMSAFVDHNKINLAEAGVDPKVLIDNTTFPVPVAQRTDTPLELPLHTFDTENTVVRNIEQMETAYDKLASVVRSHANALTRKTSAYAAYNWAPTENGDLTPVIETTGAVNAEGLKAVSFEDFLRMRAKFRSFDIDPASVVVVLNPAHEADLMAEDMKLYREVLAGGNLFGMALFSYSSLPMFDTTTKKKKAYGAAYDAAKDSMCSLIYCDTEVMRAVGTTEVFAKYKDPEQRGDVLGYQQRFTALQIRGKYVGAIYSGKPASQSSGETE